MATDTTISRPAPFVEDIGKDLAKQAVAMTGVPVVSTGITGISQQPGETAAGFKARQDAARAFEVRQQNLAGLAPKVAAQDALQRQAQGLAQRGVGSFQPFFNCSTTTSRSCRNNIRWCIFRSANSCTDTSIYVTIPITGYGSIIS